jgi:hypothetical protein
MQTVQCATFHLNTCNVDVGNVGNVMNQYGSTNLLKNDTTWNNISFKTILGDMYEKYDSFNIKLSCVMYQAIAAPSAAANEKQLKINIVGLPFSNCTYNSFMNSNTIDCAVGSFTLGIGASQIYFNDDNVFTIEKPPAMCNVRIYLTNMNDTTPVWASLGPQMDFYFRIYGIKKQLC